MLDRDEKIVLQRDCEVISVPYGETKILKQGTEVQIMQAMGGSHTVYTNEGMLSVRKYKHPLRSQTTFQMRNLNLRSGNK